MNKYIKDNNGEFVIFSGSLNHAKVAELLDIKPLSAGFIVVNDDNMYCVGASLSLGVEMRPEDSTELYDWLSGFDNKRH